jgi:hypothetical protein
MMKLLTFEIAVKGFIFLACTQILQGNDKVRLFLLFLYLFSGLLNVSLFVRNWLHIITFIVINNFFLNMEVTLLIRSEYGLSIIQQSDLSDQVPLTIDIRRLRRITWSESTEFLWQFVNSSSSPYFIPFVWVVPLS